MSLAPFCLPSLSFFLPPSPSLPWLSLFVLLLSTAVPRCPDHSVQARATFQLAPLGLTLPFSLSPFLSFPYDCLLYLHHRCVLSVSNRIVLPALFAQLPATLCSISLWSSPVQCALIVGHFTFLSPSLSFFVYLVWRKSPHPRVSSQD